MARPQIPFMHTIVQARLSSGLKKAIQDFGEKHGGWDVSSVVRGFIIDGMIRYANADKETVQKMINQSIGNEVAEEMRVIARLEESGLWGEEVVGPNIPDDYWDKKKAQADQYIQKYGDAEIIREYEFTEIPGLHKEGQK